MTAKTKKYRNLYYLFLVISLLANIGPAAAYIIDALVGGALIHEKVALCMTVFVVLIMTAVAWANKIVLRSRVWVIIIGLYFALDYFIAPLLIIGGCQIFDEWIATPVYKHYKNLFVINKQIDKRLEV
jgi:hypothetical protein